MNVELITIELKFSLDECGVNNYRTQTFIG